MLKLKGGIIIRKLILVFILCLSLSSCFIIDEIFGTSINTPRNVLLNTTWESTESDLNTIGALSLLGGGDGAFEIITINFGDGIFKWTSEAYFFGLPTSSSSTGSYTIAGSNVTLQIDGKVLQGQIIGNSLEIDGLNFRKKQ